MNFLSDFFFQFMELKFSLYLNMHVFVMIESVRDC